jgi:hypothetical protein
MHQARSRHRQLPGRARWLLHRREIHVIYADATEADITAGEVYRIGPGHDAWVVCNEPMVEFHVETAHVDEELARLDKPGAGRIVGDAIEEDGDWIVTADQEGNECCACDAGMSE